MSTICVGTIIFSYFAWMETNVRTIICNN